MLVLVPSWASDLGGSAHLSHDVASNLPLAIYGLVLIVVMITFPGGLQEAVRRFLVLPASSLGNRLSRRAP